MKLFMKQKVFSFSDKFTIKDEFENDKFYVEGEFFSFGKKLHVYDMNHNEIVFIKEKLLSFLGEYEVYINDELVTSIKNKMSFLKEKMYIEDLNWSILGNISSHEYTVVDTNGAEIISVSKAWFTWGDSYEIDIKSADNEILAVAIVLAIDCVLANNAVAVNVST